MTHASGGDVLQIPAAADAVDLKYASLAARDRFGYAWRTAPLERVAGRPGWFQIDLRTLPLVDDTYEYEFVVWQNSQCQTVADPFAGEITRFSGYRGLFHIREGRRWRWPFRWDDEFPAGVRLANNHELVIYEMPMRWMENAPEDLRQVALGTFEKVAFTRLDQLRDLGINAIELLPVLDSADTLNWGYGTRFFFAPDLDMGGPVELKHFVKQCHRRGIRVIFDVVMNHARECPLAKLDFDSYFLRDGSEEPGRGEDYGADLFRFRRQGTDGTFAAQEFHHAVAEFLIREYRADGFRIDEFRGIDHWQFIQDFRDRAWEVHQQCYPGRPFLVIAEDSWRRAVITRDAWTNPDRRKITDSMWNFTFRDEIRTLMRNELKTKWGQPSRRKRIEWMVTGAVLWDDWKQSAEPGFRDLSQAVNYLTSHDVEKEHEKRIMNYLFGPLLRWYQRPDSLEYIRWVADSVERPEVDPTDRYAHGEALERVRSAFAILFTSVGIPMILAGDEFGDVHDLDHTNYRLKMSDPVDWSRRERSANNRTLWYQVREMIQLRTLQRALQRNEVEFFHFHPAIDELDGEAVFAFCRTRGEPLGRAEQVVVVANMGGKSYPDYHLPWPWTDFDRIREVAPPAFRSDLRASGYQWAQLSLAPFQVRVFTT